MNSKPSDLRCCLTVSVCLGSQSTAIAGPDPEIAAGQPNRTQYPHKYAMPLDLSMPQQQLARSF